MHVHAFFFFFFFFFNFSVSVELIFLVGNSQNKQPPCWATIIKVAKLFLFSFINRILIHSLYIIINVINRPGKHYIVFVHNIS